MWDELDQKARTEHEIPEGYELRAVNMVGYGAYLTYRH